MTALSVRGLTLLRGGRVLAERLSFDVPPGGALLVTGPNGAGKTSLLRVLAGLGRAGGAVTAPATRALLSDRDGFDAERPLAAALHFWARLDGRSAGDVEQALAAVALADLADVPVRLLSTGQRRRAALARVIASGAALWLLDEPASGLDSRSIALLEQAVARHRGTGGIAVIATHQPLALPNAGVLDLAVPA